MHEAAHRALQVVADGIVEFVGAAVELADVGQELARDRVGGVGGIDQCGQRGRQRDRVAERDGLELVGPFGRGEAGADEGGGSCQGGSARGGHGDDCATD